ncbi:MAG: response regulator [candidate division Zixibacteria bacterium]|nr:response regulator [candidate division Zixibacteria bacterium]
MTPWAIAIVVCVVTISTFIFLIYRLRFFSTKHIGGKTSFLSGGILLSLLAAWNIISSSVQYTDLFVPRVYPIVDILELIVFLTGVSLAVIGLALYSDFWQTRRTELEIREEKVGLLSQLQTDSRQPYHFTELLQRTLKQILLNYQGTAGAVFLLNRARREFVLTSFAHLTKQETALMEHMPLAENIASQALDEGEALIGGQFDIADSSGEHLLVRFYSSLALPLYSGSEKIGVILLLAEQENHFGEGDISGLTPVAGWLSEKMKSTRLGKELASLRQEIQTSVLEKQELSSKLSALTRALGATDPLNAICENMVGVVASQSVYLCSLKHGSVSIIGGSEPITDFSESFKTALIDAFDRNRPLVINQEGTATDNTSRLLYSNLVYPLAVQDTRYLWLLRRESTPFKITESDLKALEMYAGQATLAIDRQESRRMTLAYRRGIDKILQLLGPEFPVTAFSADPGRLFSHMASLLPEGTIALSFLSSEANNGECQCVFGLNLDDSSVNEILFKSGESSLSQVLQTGRPSFLNSKAAVMRETEQYDAVNGSSIKRLYGERGVPSYMAIVPVSALSSVVGMLVVYMYDLDPAERAEWERLLTLASGLYSLRLTMQAVRETLEQEPSLDAFTQPALHESLVNNLNNHFAAVIGKAELAQQVDNLPAAITESLRQIIEEAERASADLKNSRLTAMIGTGEDSQSDNASKVTVSPDQTLNAVIDSVLKECRISGDLYMAGGRPREITVKHFDNAFIEFSSNAVRMLFENILNRFTGFAAEEDVMTVSLYRVDSFVYLDISRHRKNFPTIPRIADIGSYQSLKQAFTERPTDVFLRDVADETAYIAADKVGPTPAFLSFKFPIKGTSGAVSVVIPRQSSVRILAIDDQPLILDLIVAMCQSMGYQVDRANSGEEGLGLAAKIRYDIVFTDLAMPDISGLEVGRRLQKLQPETTIILVTGWEKGLDTAQLQLAGIQDVLRKPFRIEQLTDLVQSSLLLKSSKK